MRITGRDVLALLGVDVIYDDVPFSITEKRVLTDNDADAVTAIRERVVAARDSLVESSPGRWTAKDRVEMLDRTTELWLSQTDVLLLAELFDRCLAEFRSDFLIRPFINPLIGLQDLKAMSDKLSSWNNSEEEHVDDAIEPDSIKAPRGGQPS